MSENRIEFVKYLVDYWLNHNEPETASFWNELLLTAGIEYRKEDFTICA